MPEVALLPEVIYDGEIHPLSKDYAYISKKIYTLFDDPNQPHIESVMICFLEKYKLYLSKFDKDSVKDVDRYMAKLSYETPEKFIFIYRPAYILSPLDFYGILTMKFKRSEKDDLVVCDSH